MNKKKVKEGGRGIAKSYQPGSPNKNERPVLVVVAPLLNQPKKLLALELELTVGSNTPLARKGIVQPERHRKGKVNRKRRDLTSPRTAERV